MSRYHACGSLERMLEASQHWKEVALLSDGAVFAQEPVWTLLYLQDLKQHFIDQPDEGKDSFFVKLEKQLEATEPEVKQLAAEMLWVIYLCPDNITKLRKLGNIRLVWEWSGKSFPENSDWLAEDVLGGAGNAGTGFNTNIPDELAFFIRIMIAFKSLAESERRELLYDGWKFGKWLEQIPECDRRQFRNMIVFLLFPDDFEHIFSGTKRRDIVREFTGKANAEVGRLSALEIDRELLDIRREQEKEHDTKDLDFYAPPLSKIWQDSELENGPEPDIDDPPPEIDAMEHLYPLNQILYGPPGTGKTWNTVNRAVAIIEGKSLDEIEGEGREKVRPRFDRLKEDGQIAMVTF
ncbi:MAG: McrB, partial [Gemmatimonadota bacterium]|nr:McrB [Gemmatimonadota bacterium]